MARGCSSWHGTCRAARRFSPRHSPSTTQRWPSGRRGCRPTRRTGDAGIVATVTVPDLPGMSVPGDEPTRLAVLGSPIGHSQSPLLHAAAYRELGLSTWQYERVEVTEATLADFIQSRDALWRGLSPTMPLQRAIVPLVDAVDDVVVLTGAANTVRLWPDRTRSAYNTDVAGIVPALTEAGVARIKRGLIIGAGATAASALVALARMGARHVTVLVRRPGAEGGLIELGRRVGVDVSGRPISALGERSGFAESAVPGGLEGAVPGDSCASGGEVWMPPPPPEVVISTVPGDAQLGVIPHPHLVTAATLLDVTYAPWPTPLAAQWQAGGGEIVPGRAMLLHQAVAQVRIFLHGDAGVSLPGEARVLAAMRHAVT